jgi:2-isopropylmalate synthase
LTARSGRHALKFHLERLGQQLSKAELDEAYKRFLTLADSKLDLNDDDLLGLLTEVNVK